MIVDILNVKFDLVKFQKVLESYCGQAIMLSKSCIYRKLLQQDESTFKSPDTKPQKSDVQKAVQELQKQAIQQYAVQLRKRTKDF